MLHENAGKKAKPSQLINIAQLVSAYYTRYINTDKPQQMISFGTSGHRGSALKSSFNEAHIMAITQAVCDYRKQAGIKGILFMGMDTHALSYSAQLTALQVLAANDVKVYIAKDFGYTPTPVISHAILSHNKKGSTLCDGIVITPSHNPPSDGGFKYNPPHGGPADTTVTQTIQDRANSFLQNALEGVKVVRIDEALSNENIIHYDYVTPYVKDLENVIDMKAIQSSHIRIAADALGGSGMAYYHAIKKHYSLNMTIFNDHLDSTFSFMHCDKDGAIRMDCSSAYAMAGLIDKKDDFDIAVANDPDFDRHGIVTQSGLMNPNHFLAVSIHYLATHRKEWSKSLGIGKTLVSSSIIDKVAHELGRNLIETPVGFKWFVSPLIDGEMFFGGEESAGASFLRKDGTVFTTDKDGIIMALLACEIRAVTKKDVAQYYAMLTKKHGTPFYARIDAPANETVRNALKTLSAQSIKATTLAGEEILHIHTNAPGNNAPIGGLKIVTANGWCALRPSGTEAIYKIYAESFIDEKHLERILKEAQEIVSSIVH